MDKALKGWAFYGPRVRGQFGKRTGNTQPLLRTPWSYPFKYHISTEQYRSENRSHFCLAVREKNRGRNKIHRLKIK